MEVRTGLLRWCAAVIQVANFRSVWSLVFKSDDSKHRLKEERPTTFWCPYNAQVIQQLRAHASTGNADRFGNQSKFATTQRVFFTASRGWKGMGSKHIEPGDLLVVLLGSRVPFALRKYGMGYRLISDCYIHGLMDGEVKDWLDDGRTSLIEIGLV